MSKADKQLKENSDDKSIGYRTQQYLERIKFIDGLEKLRSIIYDDYPTEVFEYTFTFSDSLSDPKEKKLEYSEYFKYTPLLGFRKEFFAFTGEKKRQIWPLTFKDEDLVGVDRIVITNGFIA